MILLRRVDSRLKALMKQDAPDYRVNNECVACTYEVSHQSLSTKLSVIILIINTFYSWKENLS